MEWVVERVFRFALTEVVYLAQRQVLALGCVGAGVFLTGGRQGSLGRASIGAGYDGGKGKIDLSRRRPKSTQVKAQYRVDHI